VKTDVYDRGRGGMSQKEESKSKNKWRELDEQGLDNNETAMADDAHLLTEESEIEKNTSDNKLEDRINLLEKQTESYKDQVARAQAEVVNIRNRMEQEVSKARKFGVERLVSDLMPVVDSLVRGLEGAGSDDPKVQSLRKGMELTLDILSKIMEKNGILPIDPQVGDAFDPMQHEAMSMRQDPDVAPNTVLQVLQKGYALHGRVIRAAMVIVSA
jgi:molecular chaperone GrpE